MRATVHTQRSGFISLWLLGAIVGLLLVTGIGQYLWRNTIQLGNHCREAVASIGWYSGYDLCDSIGLSIVSFQRSLESKLGMSDYYYMDIEQFTGNIARQFSTSAMGFNSPSLSSFINPSFANGGGNLFQTSLSQGAMGSSLLKSGRTTQGLSYLKSSANMGDAGVLSQLSLGSVYGSGASGVPKNTDLSRKYNYQALTSIKSLQGAGTPESKKLLSALPGNPDDLAKQLKAAITSSQ